MRLPGVQHSSFSEIFFAFLLVLWRLVQCPASELWRDWMLLTAVYWIFTAVARHSRAWPLGTLATLGYLVGAYAVRQVPHTLAVLGLVP